MSFYFLSKSKHTELLRAALVLVPSRLSWNDSKWSQGVQSSWSLLLFLISAIWLHCLCAVHDQPAGRQYLSAPFKITCLKNCSDCHKDVNSRELFPSSTVKRVVAAQEGYRFFLSVTVKWKKSRDYGEVALSIREVRFSLLWLFLELGLPYLYWKTCNCLC